MDPTQIDNLSSLRNSKGLIVLNSSNSQTFFDSKDLSKAMADPKITFDVKFSKKINLPSGNPIQINNVRKTQPSSYIKRILKSLTSNTPCEEISPNPKTASQKYPPSQLLNITHYRTLTSTTNKQCFLLLC